jgi:hypothetical protein
MLLKNINGSQLNRDFWENEPPFKNPGDAP